ncbi:MAG: class I SAM-dependent methyltransferase [Chloroflexi bacterium]|nr:class I SAM-dependent methyltransferase [Chloroflexota bacterium]
MTRKDNTSLFSGRVQNYIKYRPTYPASFLDLLATRCNLNQNHVIADVGSGTGILTEMLLKNGNPVYAIEPNAEMRSAAEQLLGRYPNFTSVGAGAEATTIRSQSVDFVTAAQSFHWFDHPAARAEFIRILKPRGWVVLVWNMPRIETPFEKEYDDLWRVDLKSAHEARDKYETYIEQFFTETPPERILLEGVSQTMDCDQLIGRVLSSSAAIQPGEAGYETFIQKVRGIFECHQQNGFVTLSYKTDVFLGQLE